MPHPVSLLVLSAIYVCGAISIPNDPAFSTYNEEPSSRNYLFQTSAASFNQKPNQYVDFGNQYAPSQFSQLPQTFLNQPSTSLPSSNRYLVEFPQFLDRNPAQTQSAPGVAPPAPSYQHQDPQYSGQLHQQSPLGVQFSSAPDVSQFHFSGNGVNYSF